MANLYFQLLKEKKNQALFDTLLFLTAFIQASVYRFGIIFQTHADLD